MPLQEYYGRMLSAAEIRLHKLFELAFQERKRDEEERIFERQLLATAATYGAPKIDIPAAVAAATVAENSSSSSSSSFLSNIPGAQREGQMVQDTKDRLEREKETAAVDSSSRPMESVSDDDLEDTEPVTFPSPIHNNNDNNENNDNSGGGDDDVGTAALKPLLGGPLLEKAAAVTRQDSFFEGTLEQEEPHIRGGGGEVGDGGEGESGIGKGRLKGNSVPSTNASRSNIREENEREREREVLQEEVEDEEEEEEDGFAKLKPVQVDVVQLQHRVRQSLAAEEGEEEELGGGESKGVAEGEQETEKETVTGQTKQALLDGVRAKPSILERASSAAATENPGDLPIGSSDAIALPAAPSDAAVPVKRIKKRSLVPMPAAAADDDSAASGLKNKKRKGAAATVGLEGEGEGKEGKETLFSSAGIIAEPDWNARSGKSGSSKDSADFPDLCLEDFSLAGNQTLGLKLEVPVSSSGWAVNIHPPDTLYHTDILLHFNPRYKKNQIVMNDRQGTWGKGVLRALGKSSKVEPLLSRDLEVMIQIRSKCFLVFVNGKYCTHFAHRRDPTEFSSLKVHFPRQDDNGNPQDVRVQCVWWGRRAEDPRRDPVPESARRIIEGLPDLTATAVVLPEAAKSKSLSLSDQISAYASVAGTSAATAAGGSASLTSTASGVGGGAKLAALRTLQVTGLPEIDNLIELQFIEDALFELFADYGVEAVNLVPGKGVGFVKLEDESFVEPAIRDLNLAVIASSETDQCTLHLARLKS